MGSNSNRSETRSETLNRFASNVRTNYTSSSNWQTSKGAEIRGKMGVEKGNAFIADMKKYK
jgi:hypothetical protein